MHMIMHIMQHSTIHIMHIVLHIMHMSQIKYAYDFFNMIHFYIAHILLFKNIRAALDHLRYLKFCRLDLEFKSGHVS